MCDRTGIACPDRTFVCWVWRRPDAKDVIPGVEGDGCRQTRLGHPSAPATHNAQRYACSLGIPDDGVPVDPQWNRNTPMAPDRGGCSPTGPGCSRAEGLEVARGNLPLLGRPPRARADETS